MKTTKYLIKSSALACAFSTALLFTSHSALATEKISGGTDVPDNKYPFIVELELRPKGSNDAWGHHCGASLIAKDRLLTAAHCVIGLVTNPQEYDYRFVFGRTDRNLPAEQVVESSGVAEIKIHSRWPDGESSRDAALILLKEPITTISPVLLPKSANESDLYKPGTLVTVAGWGFVDGSFPARMREVSYPIIAPEKCNTPFEGVADQQKMLPLKLCAGAPGLGITPGDSGGPVFKIDPKTGTAIQLGINFGTRPDYPDAFTNTSDPHTWSGF